MVALQESRVLHEPNDPKGSAVGVERNVFLSGCPESKINLQGVEAESL